MPDAFEPTGEVREVRPDEHFLSLDGKDVLCNALNDYTGTVRTIYRRVPCDPAALVERDCKVAFAEMCVAWIAICKAFRWGEFESVFSSLHQRFTEQHERTPALASDMRELTARMKGTSDA